MRYSIALDSQLGTRSSNEDRLAYAESNSSLLLVAADGLGGYAGGEIAAQALVDTTIDFFEGSPNSRISDPATFLVLAINCAHNVINKRAREAGMGGSQPRTTCVLCLVQDGYAYWAHVGDSRLYHLRGKELLNRTVDHTSVDQMFHDGLLKENETRHIPAQLLRCVGGPRRPIVSLGAETRLEDGDHLLLCTDGIWRALKDRQIGALLDDVPVETGLERTFRRAEKVFRRDRDNMSAILLRWRERVTSAPAIYGMTVPRLNQDSLWRKIHDSDPGQVRQPQRRSPSDSAPQRKDKDVKTTIREIENFIEGIDDWL